MNFQMFRRDLEKAEESEIKLPTSAGSQKKQENSSKVSTSASLTMLKPLTVWITANCGKFLKRWENLICLLRNQYADQKAIVRTRLEQYTGSKLGKEHVKAIHCHLSYLNYMQSISGKMPDWMKQKLDSRLLGEISITSDMHMTPSLWQKQRGTKQPLDESEREE